MKWEYIKISLISIRELGDPATSPHREASGFNKLGAEGWELVAIDGEDMLYFKRPVVEEIQDTAFPTKMNNDAG